MQIFSLLQDKKAAEQLSAKQLYINELCELNAKMRAVHREFDSVSDESLIDGLIYELLSISNRQSFLIHAIKALCEESIEDVSLLKT